MSIINPSQTQTLRHPQVKLESAMAFSLVVLLLVLLPYLLLSLAPGTPSPQVGLGFVSLAYSTLRLAYYSIKAEKRLVVLTFWVFAYIWMGLQPLLSSWSGEFPNLIKLTDDQIIQTWLIVFVGFVSFDLGYSRLFKIKRRNPVRREPKQMRVRFHLFLFEVVASLLVSVYCAMRWGGLAALVTARNNVDVEVAALIGQQSNPIYMITENLIRVPPMVALITCIYLFKNRRHFLPERWQKKGMLALLFVLIPVNCLTCNPIQAPRFFVGMYLLCIFYIVMAWNKRSFALWSLFLTMTAFILFGLLDARNSVSVIQRGGNAQTVLGQIMQQNLVEAPKTRSTSMDYDAFGMLGLTVDYAQKEGLSMGKQLLIPVTFWIPRSLWAGKPSSTSEGIADYYDLGWKNVSCPLWAEGYINFSLFGTILLLGGYGVLASYLDRRYSVRYKDPNDINSNILVPLIAGNGLGLLRGDINTGTSYALVFVGIYFLFIHFVIVPTGSSPDGPLSSQTLAATEESV